MMGRRFWQILALLLISLLLITTGCARDSVAGNENQESQEEELMKAEEPHLKVVASFYPYYDLASRIGGERVFVSQTVPDGADPHSFEPSPRDLIRLEEADLFLYNGLGMEHWIEGALNLAEEADTKVMKAGNSVDVISYHHDHDHDHDDHDCDHDHGEWDPHIWMDPLRMKHIAQQLMDLLIEMDPEGETVYRENYQAYADKIDQLDDQYTRLAKEAESHVLLVSHSAFGYLADRYGFEEIAVTGITPHAEPSPGRLAELTDLAKDHELDVIFFETLANPGTAEVLAEEAGLTPLMLHNLEGLTHEQREAGEDYFSLMEENIQTLRKALVE